MVTNGNDEITIIKQFVDAGWMIREVSFKDANYTDSHVLLQHLKTGVCIKMLVDNCFFEEWTKTFLVEHITNIASAPVVGDTTLSDYYQLKSSLGDN